MVCWWELVEAFLLTQDLNRVLLFSLSGLICRGQGVLCGSFCCGFLSKKRKLHHPKEGVGTETPHGPPNQSELPPRILQCTCNSTNHGMKITLFAFSAVQQLVKNCRSEVCLALRFQKSFSGRSLWNVSKAEIKMERRNYEETESMLLIYRLKSWQMFAERQKQLWPIFFNWLLRPNTGELTSLQQFVAWSYVKSCNSHSARLSLIKQQAGGETKALKKKNRQILISSSILV